jgi:hypothetical protein
LTLSLTVIRAPEQPWQPTRYHQVSGHSAVL